MLRVLAITIFIHILLTSIPHNLNAQKWEIGGLIGGTSYLGDISKDPNINNTGLAVNLWGRRNLTRHFSYRFGGGYGQISDHDSLHEAGKLRQLGFRSNIWEFSNIIEFHYAPFGLDRPRNSKLTLRHIPQNKLSTFYVFTGINLFYFNPKAKRDGVWYALQPLGTEGQNAERGKGRYSRVTVSIPAGAGLKFKLTQNWILGFEVGYRFTFTDYLDDVSDKYPDMTELAHTNGNIAVGFSDPTTINNPPGEWQSATGDMRGDPHLRDAYIFTGITLSYRFTPQGCPSPRKSKKRRYQNVD